MKILPVVQTFNAENKETSPSFGAKIPKNVSGDIFTGLSNAVKTDELARTIKSQLTNPAKKNTFFATVAALITATAAQLTEIVTGEQEEVVQPPVIEPQKPAKEVKNSDGDVFEAKVEQKPEVNIVERFKFSKHKGTTTKFETDLSKAIIQVSNLLKVSDANADALKDLYNKFCGANYKGCHYSENNEKIQNQDIAKNLTADLLQCQRDLDLRGVISKYNKYAAEPDMTDSETIKIIKDYDKLTESYIAITKEKNNAEKQGQIESFLKSLNQIPVAKSLKQMWLKTIDSSYTDCLVSLASVYNEISANSAESTEKFLNLLNNKQILNEALQKWTNAAYKYYLNFFEYNSMLKAGMDDNSIKEVAQLKRNTKVDNVTIKDSDTFSVKPPYEYINKNFYFINALFRQIHSKENYYELKSSEPEKYTIDDIEAEVLKHSDSYPNLKRHLAVKDKSYLNQGKMQNLLNLYYGDKMNKNLFTMHSYLRFIERVVIPTINEYNGLEDANYCNIINKTYIGKLKELRQIIQNEFKQTKEFQTYTAGNIKAPQFTIPMINSNGEEMVITINNDNKIHTIF